MSMMEARTIRIPIGPSGSGLTTNTRDVSFIKTRTPGIVITPAADVYGHVSFTKGCNLTHAPSGFRLAGTFQDVGVARLVAAAVGGVMDWDARELTDYRVVVIAARAALTNAPKLLEWLAALNEWEVSQVVTR
jgi:hypothetical protein